MMNRYLYWVMLLYCALVPLTYNPSGGAVRPFQERMFEIFAMCFVVSFIKSPHIVLFFFLNIALYYMNKFQVGSQYVFNIFLGILIFAFSRRYFAVSKGTKVITQAFILIFLVDAFFMTLQIFGIDPLHRYADTSGRMISGMELRDPTGMFGLKAHHGIFLALLMPIIAQKSVILSLVLLPLIWKMQSSAALLAAVVGIVFYCYYNGLRFKLWIPFLFPDVKRVNLKFFTMPFILPKGRIFRFKPLWILLLPLIFIPMMVYYIAVKDFRDDPLMFNSRWGVWHAAFTYTLKKPLGWGPDSWRSRTPTKGFLIAGDEDRRTAVAVYTGTTINEQKQKTDHYKYQYYHPNPVKREEMIKNLPLPKSPNKWDHSHSEYVQILFQYGYPGFVLMLAFFWHLYKRFSRTPKTKDLVMISSMLMVIFVACTTQFPFHVARLAWIFPVLLGYFYAKTDRKSQNA